MSAAGRREVDALLVHVQAAGFDVQRWGASHWRVTRPDGGGGGPAGDGSVRILASAPGRRIHGEKSKLRSIGAPTNEEEVRKFLAAQPKPPAAEPEPDPVVTQPLPPAEPEPVESPTDIATASFYVWDEIRDGKYGDTAAQNLEDIPGRTWRGSFAEVTNTIWPGLSNESRRAMNAFLRRTGNMRCLVKGTPSLWWIRSEWFEVPTETRGVAAVRPGPARPRQPRLSDGVERPVTVTLKAPAAVPPVPPAPPRRAAKATAPKPTPWASAPDDPVAAITAVVTRVRELEAQLATVTAERDDALDRLNQFRQAMRGLAV